MVVSVPLDLPAGGLDGDELDRGKRVGLWRNRGVGKFDFLSMDSRVRSKRRKSASARMRIASRSRVLESSLTDRVSNWHLIMWRWNYHTIFQYLIKLLEVIHNNTPVLVENGQSNKEMEIAREVVRP